jgi:hypothetical protein
VDFHSNSLDAVFQDVIQDFLESSQNADIMLMYQSLSDDLELNNFARIEPKTTI